MSINQATAIAHPNIALIKYWGNRDEFLRLPVNGSISMNLDGLTTHTTVIFDSSLKQDTLELNKQSVSGQPLDRVRMFLDLVRAAAEKWLYARVVSQNDFPISAGIASSASAFAALALAASTALGLELNSQNLSRLARRGSGSACRSIPDGFCEWLLGNSDEDSFAYSIAPTSHWDLLDCIVIVQQGEKAISSIKGHRLANTSPLQAARVADCPRRLDICRRAIADCDFESLAKIVELDSNLMHAVMMTSSPTIQYMQPTTLTIIHAVQQWRQEGISVCYTLDAGPNVHVLCQSIDVKKVLIQLTQIPGVLQVIKAKPGNGARLIQSPP
jgi:diphosphomevalonate decarboxylase